MDPRTNRRARGATWLALGLALAIVGAGLLAYGGRSAGLRGVFEADDGIGRLDFRRGGRVYVTSVGGTFASEYELDGDLVILRGAGGSQVLTREGDRLEGGFGKTYSKR